MAAGFIKAERAKPCRFGDPFFTKCHRSVQLRAEKRDCLKASVIQAEICILRFFYAMNIQILHCIALNLTTPAFLLTPEWHFYVCLYLYLLPRFLHFEYTNALMSSHEIFQYYVSIFDRISLPLIYHK